MAKKTKSQTDSLKKEVSELKDKYLRLAAEFENYKRRTSKEKAESIRYGKESIINSILTILDDFERANGIAVYNQNLKKIFTKGMLFELLLDDSTKLITKNLINCCGLNATNFAQQI